jgi:hypothetical protein
VEFKIDGFSGLELGSALDDLARNEIRLTSYSIVLRMVKSAIPEDIDVRCIKDSIGVSSVLRIKFDVSVCYETIFG